MEEIKDKIIVLKSVPSKEKDKIITAFSLNGGIIKATLKGVLNPKAKFKFLAQPFCFADVVLNSKNGFNTVIAAYPIETFYGVTSDIDKYSKAAAVLEVLSTFSLNEAVYPTVFLSALKTLKFIEEQQANPQIALIKFLLEVFKYSGYDFKLDKCSECGTKILTEPYFDLDAGNIFCLACKNEYSIKITKNVLLNLKIIHSEDYDKLSSIKVNSSILDEIIDLLKKFYKAKFNIMLKSL